MDETTDMQADMKAVRDAGEATYELQPLLLGDSNHRGPLIDLAVELAQKSSGLRRSLPQGLHGSLIELIRAANAYYNHLLEGQDMPLAGPDPARMNDPGQDSRESGPRLALRAHTAVEEWIDGGGLQGRSTTAGGICELHRRLYENYPEELLRAQEAKTKEKIRVFPGEFRRGDLNLGTRVAVSPGAIPRFLGRFEKAYKSLHKMDSILAIPTAHHRLLWISPFSDHNGLVARLVSHANLLETLDTGGVWSIVRGLARKAEEYRKLLTECDSPRQNDLDGHGARSEKALARFAYFFLSVCLEEIQFMEKLLKPDQLRSRILLWATEQIRAGSLPAKSSHILEAILDRGELPRSNAAATVGATDRHARRIVSSLIERDIVKAESARSPLRLVFPVEMSPFWMPGLLPESIGVADQSRIRPLSLHATP